MSVLCKQRHDQLQLRSADFGENNLRQSQLTCPQITSVYRSVILIYNMYMLSSNWCNICQQQINRNLSWSTYYNSVLHNFILNIWPILLGLQRILLQIYLTSVGI